jgi:hypothetical protein
MTTITPTTTTAAWPGYAIVGGAAAVLLGSVLPWVVVNAPLVGRIEVAGTEGDGKITLLLGALAFTCLARSGWKVLGILSTLGAVAVAIYDVTNVSNAISEASGSVSASVGMGLWLVLAGAVACLTGAVAKARTP